jgi:hypothetical protein
MALAEVIEIPCNPNVLLTVLDDFVDLTQSPPLEGLHPVGDLALTEGCRSDAVELWSKAETLLEVEHQIEGRELLEVLFGVSPKYLVVETTDVVSDDKRRLEEEIHEIGDGVLGDNQKLVPIITIRHTDRNSESVELAAATDLGEGSLSLEIENDDLLTLRHLALRVRVEEVHLTVPVLQDFLLYSTVRGGV